MKVLHLTLKKRWFDLIASGKKTEEYRECKTYWIKRLRGRVYDEIHFRNGYRVDSPFMRVEWKGVTCVAYRYIIKLGRISEIKNRRSTRQVGDK